MLSKYSVIVGGRKGGNVFRLFSVSYFECFKEKKQPYNLLDIKRSVLPRHQAFALDLCPIRVHVVHGKGRKKCRLAATVGVRRNRWTAKRE